MRYVNSSTFPKVSKKPQEPLRKLPSLKEGSNIPRHWPSQKKKYIGLKLLATSYVLFDCRKQKLKPPLRNHSPFRTWSPLHFSSWRSMGMWAPNHFPRSGVSGITRDLVLFACQLWPFLKLWCLVQFCLLQSVRGFNWLNIAWKCSIGNDETFHPKDWPVWKLCWTLKSWPLVIKLFQKTPWICEVGKLHKFCKSCYFHW